jgi:hypothetical protein
MKMTVLREILIPQLYVGALSARPFIKVPLDITTRLIYLLMPNYFETQLRITIKPSEGCF